MAEFRDSVMERPSLALARLVHGDLSGTARALVSPDSLSPTQHRTLADEWGVGQGNRAYDLVVRTITNPLVLAGAVLAFRYPIPLAKDMFKYSERLSGWTKKVGPFMRKVGNIDELFPGTPIPENYKQLVRDVDVFRREHADRIAQAILDAQAKGLKWEPRTQVLLAAKLDGLDDPAAKGLTLFRRIEEGPVFDKLVSDVRAVQGEVWEKLFGGAQGRGRLRQRATRSIYGQLRDQFPDIERVEKYFPHMLSRDPQAYEETTQRLIRQSLGMEKAFGNRALSASGRVSTPAALVREWKMFPAIQDADLAKEYLLPGAKEKLVALAGDEKGKSYSLRFMEVMSSYLHSTSRAFGWTVAKNPKGEYLGDVLGSSVTKLMEHDPVRASMMRDSYIPLALGRQTFSQAMGNAVWSQRKIEVVKRLEEPWAKKLIPNNMREWMVGKIRNDTGSLSLQNVSARLTGYMYLGALGGNPVSAGYNLMQTLITTVPMIGPKYTAKGFEETFKRVPAYFRMRAAGVTHDGALTKAFPEFAKEGLVSAGLVDEAISRELNRSWEATLSIRGPAGKVVDRAKTALMAMFQGAENLNRLVAFNGARSKALAEGLGAEEAGIFARQVTERSQYLSGPANRPYFLLGKNPLMQQFLSFGGRTAGFGVSATEFGSGAKSGLLGRNWGTLGRVGLSSGVAYEMGREILNKDISHGLFFGALPVPSPDAPFSPAPFVPPILSVAGAVGQDVLRGEFKQTKYALPILFPGGLAASRFAGMVSPEAGKFLGRGYADYSNPLPDGRIPTFTSDGALKGYKRPMELYTEALGLSDGTGQNEQELTQYFLAQRDRMRQYKREYLDAEEKGDLDHARQLQVDFEEEYPGVGGIQVKPQDRRAVHLRTQVSRIERLLETMPVEQRGQFAEMISTTLGQEAESLMGVDPFLLQRLPTISARDPWREKPPAGAIETLYRRKQQAGLTALARPTSGSGSDPLSLKYPNPQVRGPMVREQNRGGSPPSVLAESLSNRQSAFGGF